MKFLKTNSVKEIETVNVEEERQIQLDQIGLALQQAREAQNIDLEVISGQLHIPISLLNAIETADFTKLPEPIFIKQMFL